MDNNTLTLTDHELDYLLTLMDKEDKIIQNHRHYGAYAAHIELLRKLHALGDKLAERQAATRLREEW